MAVDWSGAKTGAEQHIWLAHVRDGRLRELANGRCRSAVVEHLINLKSDCPAGLFVGLDFSFSLPAWFLRQRDLASASDLWREVVRHGEAWLSACAPPFWGKKGDHPPPLEARLRKTEAQAVVDGIRAKSTFQVRGAGSVGTGSLRGMPYLLDLQRTGFSIWPFDPPSPFTVLEVYPRLCTGAVNKSDALARAEYLRGSSWALTPAQRETVIGSHDAFDAAVSALVMHEHTDNLHTLRQAASVHDALEGMIWDPNNIPP